MLNINDLKAKAAGNGMSIIDLDNGKYAVYSEGVKIGADSTLDELQASDYWGLFDEIVEIDDSDEYLCTNGSNSSFKVRANNAQEALDIAVKLFDSQSDYILPITARNEIGDDIAEVY